MVQAYTTEKGASDVDKRSEDSRDESRSVVKHFQVIAHSVRQSGSVFAANNERRHPPISFSCSSLWIRLRKACVSAAQQDPWLVGVLYDCDFLRMSVSGGSWPLIQS